MATTEKAPMFVWVGNVLTTTLLRAGFKFNGNPFDRNFGVTAASSLAEFARAVLTHPLFLLEKK